MIRKLRVPMMAFAAASLLPLVASANPGTFERFESCEAAREAVAAAGPAGLATDKPFYVVVYDDPQCYQGPTDRFTSFPEEREVAGEQCRLGYVCVENPPSE